MGMLFQFVQTELEDLHCLSVDLINYLWHLGVPCTPWIILCACFVGPLRSLYRDTMIYGKLTGQSGFGCLGLVFVVTCVEND